MSNVSGVTILLSLTVFHNLVAETLPQVSDAMPVLGTKTKQNTVDKHLKYFYILYTVFHAKRQCKLKPVKNTLTLRTTLSMTNKIPKPKSTIK
jgi:hypothetical protein